MKSAFPHLLMLAVVASSPYIAKASQVISSHSHLKKSQTRTNDLANNFSKDPMPKSGKELCNQLNSGKVNYQYCMVEFNSTNHELNISTRVTNGDGKGVIPSNDYGFELASPIPEVINVTITNPITSAVIYSGIPTNWIGLICDEAQCKDWN